MKINCYFSPIPDVCIYKKKWYTQLIHGINKTESSLHIVNSIQRCNIIFTIINTYSEIYEKDKEYIDKNNVKFIIISCQDTPFEDLEIFKNQNILLVLDHCRKNYVQNPKIVCLLNTQNRFIYNENAKKLKDRQYDLVFFGKIKLGNDYETHRTQVVNKMNDFGKKYQNYKVVTGEFVSMKEYLHYLENSKILISPYGFGVWSLKEFEAVCNGTHVVKPNIYYECYPNYYKNMDHYSDDLNKFDETILNVLENIDIVQDKVDKNREMFRNYNFYIHIKELEMLIHERLN